MEGVVSKEKNVTLNIEGFRFDNIRTNARLSNGIIDTPYMFNSNLTKYADAHLKDCKANPTLGLLARQQANTNYYPKQAYENMSMLKREDFFIKTDKEFRNICDALYPQTNKVRRQLIKNESIVLDRVKPIKKNFTRTLVKLFGNLM